MVGGSKGNGGHGKRRQGRGNLQRPIDGDALFAEASDRSCAYVSLGFLGKRCRGTLPPTQRHQQQQQQQQQPRNATQCKHNLAHVMNRSHTQHETFAERLFVGPSRHKLIVQTRAAAVPSPLIHSFLAHNGFQKVVRRHIITGPISHFSSDSSSFLGRWLPA